MSKYNLSSRLSTLRADKTRNKFATEIGISRQCITHYETNKRIPTAEFVFRVCQMYGVSADWLLGLSDDKEIKK